MDVIARGGHLFLGSRLKRLGERMQADVSRVIAAAGLPIQPGHYPILALVEREAMTVGDIAAAIGTSQPAVTRSVARLVELGLVEVARGAGDARQRVVTPTAAGTAVMRESRAFIWPQVERAAIELARDLPGALLALITALEERLAAMPLDRRVAEWAGAGLRIRPFEDALAGAFHDINAEWIAGMFAIEPTDRRVMEDPRGQLIAPGGDILFVEADGAIVGTCALRRTGEGQFELTKMGVTAAARGRKAGEFLLHAIIARARMLGAKRLYLLTNKRNAPAIHLYEKLGFVHDDAIMREFGASYARCDVAMLYRGALAE